MSTEALIVLAIISTVIWISVSKEAIKPTKEVDRLKMNTLLSAGTLTAIILTVSLFQHLLF